MGETAVYVMLQFILPSIMAMLTVLSIAVMLVALRMGTFNRHTKAMIDAFFDMEKQIYKKQIAEGNYGNYVSIGSRLCEKYALNSYYRDRHMLRVTFFMNPWTIYPPDIAYMVRKGLGYDDRWHRSAYEKSRYRAWKHIAKGRAFVPGYRTPSGGHAMMVGYSQRYFGKPAGFVRWNNF